MPNHFQFTFLFRTTHHKYGVDILTLETTQEKDLSFVAVFFPSYLSSLPFGFPCGFSSFPSGNLDFIEKTPQKKISGN